MNEGKIVQCIGAVVDVEFPRESIPKVYDALKIGIPIKRIKKIKWQQRSKKRIKQSYV